MKNLKLALVFGIILGCGLMFSTGSVYAVDAININCNTTGTWEDGNGGTAVATSNGETVTLTLNNYNGGGIASSCNLILALNGNNSLNGLAGGGLATIYMEDRTLKGASLTISGDGNLDILKNGYDGIKIKNGNFTLNSGRVNISTSYVAIEMFWNSGAYVYLNGGELNILEAREGIKFGTDHSGPAGSDETGKLHINGAKVNINVTPENGGERAIGFVGDNWRPGLIVVDDGELNVKVNGNSSEAGIEASVFNQNGGVVNIQVDNDLPAATMGYAVFNGGTATFSSGESVGLAIQNTENEERLAKLAEIGAVLPKNGAIVEINDGDVTMDGQYGAFAIRANSYEGISLDNAVTINDGLTIEPANTKFSNVAMGDIEVFAFSDGEGELEVDMSNGSINHIAKTLHIYKAAVPVPDADDEPAETEENPNTVDARIGFLAFGILVAVLAECGIIIDLYRRLFGIKEQITEAEGIEEKTEDCDGKA